MNIIGDFATGLISVLRVTAAPLLYRYPYRTSAEGLRSDWMRIADDVKSIMGKMEADAHDGQ